VEFSPPHDNNMPYLSAVDVDDSLVDDLWNRVESCGSFYSIGDGVSKEVFRKVLFASALVLRGESVVIRLEASEVLEAHPIVLGHSFFRHAKEALSEVVAIRDRLFASRPVCCIIPVKMRGTKALARIAGMTQTGAVMRSLSGVAIPCAVFTWR